MAWDDDPYTRKLLDARERWGTLMSLTAVAALLMFLSDHSHSNWIKLGPLVLGVYGSLYVLVVNCYYKQGAAVATAENKEEEKAKKWYVYAPRIRILGWLHILAPVVLGAFATLTLYCGLLPTPADAGTAG